MIALADVNYFEPWWIQIIKALVIFAVIFAILPMLIVYERKLLGRFQGRYGPNRVGPFGLLQPLAEIVKFATKEPFRPTTSVGYLFRIAPAIVDHHRGRRAGDHPVGRRPAHLRTAGRPVRDRRVDRPAVRVRAGRDLVLRDHARRLGVGLQVLVPRLDARRRAADLLRGRRRACRWSGVMITAQTLSLTGIVHAQEGMWFFIPQFAGFLIFMVASFAETNRAPFDLVEADAELVGGYFTEYGGTPFVAYLFAEYANMIVVSGMAVTIFLGGWLLPFGIRPAGLGRPDRRAGEDRDRLHASSSGSARRFRACATTS